MSADQGDPPPGRSPQEPTPEPLSAGLSHTWELLWYKECFQKSSQKPSQGPSLFPLVLGPGKILKLSASGAWIGTFSSRSTLPSRLSDSLFLLVLSISESPSRWQHLLGPEFRLAGECWPGMCVSLATDTHIHTLIRPLSYSHIYSNPFMHSHPRSHPDPSPTPPHIETYHLDKWKFTECCLRTSYIWLILYLGVTS